jgi:hypothetical protein
MSNYRQCAIITAICVIISASAYSQTTGSRPVIDTLILRSPNDTVFFMTGDNRGSFTLDQLNDGDSARFYCRKDIILSTTIDTLKVNCIQMENPLKIVGSGKSVTINLFIVAQEDKSDILKKYPAFGNTPVAKEWQFSYSDSTDLNLNELRHTYNLDSVAGQGSEIERIINLMTWAHCIVKHDGNSENPEPRDALNLIAVSKKENRGVNCRMMATILNEVYLAMGYKSRHITCMPYDKNDQDCHVVNIVYSRTLNKWLYMDPTFEGYFMGEDSIPLSIEEIRQRMISGQELVINPNLNWNGDPYDKEDYYYYLAKNLFRFTSPVKSSFGYESKIGEVIWICLNPVGYDSLEVGMADTTKSSQHTHINYMTDDAAYFWGRP